MAPLLRQRRTKGHQSPRKSCDNNLASKARAARDFLQTMADEDTSAGRPQPLFAWDDTQAADSSQPLVLQCSKSQISHENLLEFQSPCGETGSAGILCWTPTRNHAPLATSEYLNEHDLAAFKLHLRRRRQQLMRQLLISRRRRPSWRDPWPPPALAQPGEHVRSGDEVRNNTGLGHKCDNADRPSESIMEGVESVTEQLVAVGVDLTPSRTEQEAGPPGRRRRRSASADSVSFLKRRRQESDGEGDASGEDIEVCPSVHRRPRCLQGLPRPELLLLAGQLERRFF
jgi:hypothetical protein